ATAGFSATPEKNRVDHAKLLKAYGSFAEENGVGALSSRCWPDFFTEYGTPVCTVLSMLNDRGIASSCEGDVYGALSMWVGSQASGSPVFFGDPVSLDESENTVTFWHCGAAAPSLARKDTGAAVGVHPNRKIGPVMDFGVEALGRVTVFRIGRESDGSFRFFLAEGNALDKPKQFTGTSVVVKTDEDARFLIEDSVSLGFEPHFVVMKGSHAELIKSLAALLRIPVVEY
ncbi:MAG: fucose isomerase, partial [Lachnospiraceae bacterium]|nr:fucose isomerase [Lachnospiraceae bacterium]